MKGVIIMLTFFDYVFYRIARYRHKSTMWFIETFYPKSQIKDDNDLTQERFMSAMCIVYFQFINLLALLKHLFPSFYQSLHSYYPMDLIILCSFFGILAAFDFFFVFSEKKIEKCQTRWDDESKIYKRLKGVLVLAYFSASFIFCFFV
jgi:hypothetical protein